MRGIHHAGFCSVCLCDEAIWYSLVMKEVYLM
jgi:hypothetical protein